MTGCVDEGVLEFDWQGCRGDSDKKDWELLFYTRRKHIDHLFLLTWESFYTVLFW